jgi:hypothetical protein
MATQIHFVRRDQDLAVDEEPHAVAAAASGGGPIRLTGDTGPIFVNWAQVLYIEAVPVAVPAGS